MDSKFCEILSELRKKRSVSQRKAAADLKISQALLSHYENGAREPGLEFVCRACDYYGVSADYILGRLSDVGNEDKMGVIDRLLETNVLLKDNGNAELYTAVGRYLSSAISNIYSYVAGDGTLASSAEYKKIMALSETDIIRLSDGVLSGEKTV